MSRLVIVAWVAVSLCLPIASAENGAGREGPGDSGGSADGGLSEQQKAELLQFLKRGWPDRYKLLEDLKKDSRRTYERSLKHYWKFYRRWKGTPPEVQKAWITMTESRVKAWRLVEKLSGAGQGERPGILKDLHKAVGAQVDAEVVWNQYRLARLEKRLEELRAELKQQAEKRKQVVEQRVEDLLEEARSEAEAGADEPQRPTTRPAGSQ